MDSLLPLAVGELVEVGRTVVGPVAVLALAEWFSAKLPQTSGALLEPADTTANADESAAAADLLLLLADLSGEAAIWLAMTSSTSMLIMLRSLALREVALCFAEGFDSGLIA